MCSSENNKNYPSIHLGFFPHFFFIITIKNNILQILVKNNIDHDWVNHWWVNVFYWCYMDSDYVSRSWPSFSCRSHLVTDQLHRGRRTGSRRPELGLGGGGWGEGFDHPHLLRTLPHIQGCRHHGGGERNWRTQLEQAQKHLRPDRGPTLWPWAWFWHPGEGGKSHKLCRDAICCRVNSGSFFLITISKVCVTHKVFSCLCSSLSNLFVFIIIVGLYPVFSVGSSFFMSLHGRNVTARLKGGWWCVAMAHWRETEFSAYWATITDGLGTMAAWWKASLSIVQRGHRTSIQMNARYNCSCFYKHDANVPG